MSELEPTRTYSNHTATEKLRRMLDERGGFRVDFDREGARRTCWKIDDEQDGYCYFDEDVFGVTQLTVTRITPEQAIAATLGLGTCKRVMDSIDPFAMWVCDHCGHPLDTSESFCGGCGRKVVAE